MYIYNDNNFISSLSPPKPPTGWTRKGPYEVRRIKLSGLAAEMDSEDPSVRPLQPYRAKDFRRFRTWRTFRSPRSGYQWHWKTWWRNRQISLRTVSNHYDEKAQRIPGNGVSTDPFVHLLSQNQELVRMSSQLEPVEWSIWMISTELSVGNCSEIVLKMKYYLWDYNSNLMIHYSNIVVWIWLFIRSWINFI